MKKDYLKQLFSIDYQGSHRVITLCGIQFKFHNKSKEILDSLLRLNRELLYRDVFVDTIKDSDWLKQKSFTLVGGSANYSLIMQLYIILDTIKPNNILEFGLGQTSIMTTQYANFYDKNLTIIEHNQNWIDVFNKRLTFCKNSRIIQKNLINVEINGTHSDKYSSLEDIVQDKKFDLVIIDGPVGGNRKYPRTNILDLVPDNLNERFIIILDDTEREGEQNTANLLFKKLGDNNINYKKSYKHGYNSQLLISNFEYEFIHWY